MSGRIHAHPPACGRAPWRAGRVMGTCFAATVGLGAQAQPVAAPSAGTVFAQIRSLDRFEAEQERLREMTKNQPAAYQDSFLQPDDTPATVPDGQDGASEPEGVRYWLAEAQGVWSRRSQSGLATQRSLESGPRCAGHRRAGATDRVPAAGGQHQPAPRLLPEPACRRPNARRLAVEVGR